MELDRYGRIIRRRLPLIVAIVLLTAVLSAVYAAVAPGGYTASTALLINPLSPPTGGGATYYYPPYYQEQAAQYILDDFAGVIKGTTFSEQVIAILKQSPQADVRALAEKMNGIDQAEVLSKRFTVNRVNRLLQVQVTGTTRDEALALAAATDQLVKQQGPLFFAQLTQAKTGAGQPPPPMPVVSVGVSDAPHITLKPSHVHAALLWLLRTAVGLVAALAIVLVLHYFDDRLYDEYDVREMVGLPVLGAVTARPVRPGVSAERSPVRERKPVTAP